MSETVKDGGPAFPIPNATDLDGYVYAPEASGMSLRDWFAGQVLAGVAVRTWEQSHTQDQIIPAWAKAAYLTADAMLEARKLAREADGLVEELVAALEEYQNAMQGFADEVRRTTGVPWPWEAQDTALPKVDAALSRAREGV